MVMSPFSIVTLPFDSPDITPTCKVVFFLEQFCPDAIIDAANNRF